MIHSVSRILVSASVAALLSVSAAFSGTTVARCEFKDQGNMFVPGVRICSPTGITDIKVGEQGLTREIFFNDKALMSYANSRFDLSLLDLAAGVCNRCDALEEGKDEQAKAADYDEPTDEPSDEPIDTPTDGPSIETDGN